MSLRRKRIARDEGEDMCASELGSDSQEDACMSDDGRSGVQEDDEDVGDEFDGGRLFLLALPAGAIECYRRFGV